MCCLAFDFNLSISQENFRSLVNLTEKAREQYREMIVQIEKEIAEHPPRVSVPGVPHIFAHMGHSRTPSGCSVISFTSSILSEPISENYPHSEPETDHRGYEIEKDNDHDHDDDINDDNSGDNDNDDAYEADDESGFDGKKKKRNKDKLKNLFDERSKGLDENTEYIIVNSGDNLGRGFTSEQGPPRRPGILKNSSERLRNQGIRNVNGESGVGVVDFRGDTSDGMMSSQYDRSLDLIGGSIKSNQNNHDNAKSAKISMQFDGSGEKSRNKAVDYGKGKMTEHLDENDLIDKDMDFKPCEDNSDFDREFENENLDIVKDLPQFIDSVHSFDLTEILSQHSTKTVENGEDVLSTHSSKTTHSSRTLEGSVPRTLESTGLSGDRVLDVKPKEAAVLGLKGKAKVDKENRTLSWVKEAQHLHFSEQVEQGRELDDTIAEVNGISKECLDAAA